MFTVKLNDLTIKSLVRIRGTKWPQNNKSLLTALPFGLPLSSLSMMKFSYALQFLRRVIVILQIHHNMINWRVHTEI